AAGLAHELNNPAAAARRSAAELAEALDVVSSTIRHFVESGIERAEAQQLVELHDEAVAAAAKRTALDALDAADAEDDLHEGLETTLVVLGHKLKHTRIEVVRDYDRALPKLTVHGSELNQVWTNLLDNAIDALGSEGTITIETRRDGTCAVVDVSDDGP